MTSAVQETQVEPPVHKRRSSQGAKRRSGKQEVSPSEQEASKTLDVGFPPTEVKKRGSAPPGNTFPQVTHIRI